MGIFPSEYEGRQHGLMRSRSTTVAFYISKHPGPSEDKHMAQMYSDAMMDAEYERGGVDAVSDALGRFLEPIFRELRQELLKPYREAAREANRPVNKFGPLGAFLEMGRPDIIAKIALEEHEERKKGQ